MSILVLVSTYLTTFVSILLLRPIARKAGLIDSPGGRKTHSKDTPLIGGIGIFLGLITGCILSPEVFIQYKQLLLISCILLFTGLIDDYFPLPAIIRLGIQILAAWLMCTWGNNQLITLGRLFGDSELFLGRYAIVMTIFATVGVINAINMIDGMDGLSGGMILICLGCLAIAAGTSGNNPPLFHFSLIAMVGMAAFLLLNFRAAVNKPALIYLGDSGSTMLGFILAWLLIESSQGIEQIIPATIALWFVAIPLIDTVYLFITRPLSGKSPFEPGIDHLHHVLELHGVSKVSVVLLLYCAGIVFGGAGLLLAISPEMEKYSIYIFLGIFFIYVLIMKLYKSPEES